MEVLKIRTIISDNTLFFTLENVVLLKIRTEHRDWHSQLINSEKYKYFQQLLAPTALSAHSIYKLRDHMAYGSIFWTFRQELGIASLLMAAVWGHGLTITAKRTGPQS